jgi:hypothetical protein
MQKLIVTARVPKTKRTNLVGVIVAINRSPKTWVSRKRAMPEIASQTIALPF